MLNIRQETPNDFTQVYQVVKLAFANAEYSDHDEQNLVERLRSSSSFIPELSLVAELDGKIVGHILFTKLAVGNTTQLALAPLAVHPDFQCQGIGGQLIKKGHEIAAAMGYDYSILLGHPSYYPRFGYLPASRFGITSPFDVPDENYMAFDLSGKGSILSGPVVYPKEF